MSDNGVAIPRKVLPGDENKDIGHIITGCTIGYYFQFFSCCCPDVNECEVMNGMCQQLCEDNDGSYDCLCEDGYVQSEVNPLLCKGMFYSLTLSLLAMNHDVELHVKDPTPSVTSLQVQYTSYTLS